MLQFRNDIIGKKKAICFTYACLVDYKTVNKKSII